MAIHVAILKRPYLELILRGRKTIESRLTTTAQPPFGRIAAGERLFFKVSAGPFMATALAGRVEQFSDLNVSRMHALYRQFNAGVCGEAAYWQFKKHSRYAVFVHLREVQPIDVGPTYEPNNWKAWFVLPESASPLRDWPLTAGAIRNRYVRPPDAWGDFFPSGGTFTLELPDGRAVTTDINVRKLIRWRGWGEYYERAGAKPGDRVRFVRLADRRYRVIMLTGQSLPHPPAP